MTSDTMSSTVTLSIFITKNKKRSWVAWFKNCINLAIH